MGLEVKEMLYNNCYWNTATFISLCIVYGCFCTTMAELSSCDRDHMWPSKPKIYTMWLFTQKPC